MSDRPALVMLDPVAGLTGTTRRVRIAGEAAGLARTPGQHIRLLVRGTEVEAMIRRIAEEKPRNRC